MCFWSDFLQGGSSTLEWWDFTLAHAAWFPWTFTCFTHESSGLRARIKLHWICPPPKYGLWIFSMGCFPSRITCISNVHRVVDYIFSYSFLVTETLDSLKTGFYLGNNQGGWWRDKREPVLTFFLSLVGIWDNKPQEVLIERNPVT